MKLKLYLRAAFLYSVFIIGGLSGCTTAVIPATSSPVAVPTEQTPAPTRTATFLPTLTWTARPTLTEDESVEAIRDLTSTNGGCRLPCVWGFTPGVTTWSEAEAFLLTLRPEIDIVGPDIITRNSISYIANSYYVSYQIPEMPRRVGIRIGVLDGIVSDISAGYGKPLELDNILSEYGEPQEAYIDTLADFPGGDMPFILTIYYPDQHFFAKYEVTARKQNGLLIGCLQGTSPYLFTWSQAESEFVTTQRVLDWIGGATSTKPLEEVTDMDINSFYNIFKNPTNSTCIETSEEYWPYH
jgi:hypothetical protein